MLDLILHKFYAASISVAPDGSMLVSSTRDRMMAWGMLFCFIAACALITYLLSKNNYLRKVSLSVFTASLLIPVFIMPSIRQEYIHVTPQEITINTGRWYADVNTILSLHKLDYIAEEVEGFMPGNLIGDPSVVWHVNRHNGERERYELNDFFNAHRMVVAYYIKDRGFIVRRLEDQIRN